MISLVNSHTNATSKRWQLGEIDLRFALNSIPGRLCSEIPSGASQDNSKDVTLETTQGQKDAFLSRLPFKCYLPEVVSVGDLT